PAPGEAVTLLFSTNILMPIERVAVYYTTDGTEPRGERGTAINGAVVLAEKSESTYDAARNYTLQQWQAVLPGQPDGTLVRYRADAWSLSDPQQHWYADNADPVTTPTPQGRRFAYHVDHWEPPTWWHDAVVYHIFVDRFHAARGEPAMRDYDEHSDITAFFGGTLNGVIEKLDYIQALGANCLWLSPVFESPTHHGYNPSDYYTVARRYGTNETLRELIHKAHERGMRVLLDFVANHTSDEHPAFISAYNDPNSETKSWYAFGDGLRHGYRSYAHVRNMPELMTENPAVQRYLQNAVLHWLEYFGADGLRLDYVSGPSHAFWTLFQQAIKERFPQALTLGEITGTLPEIANYEGRMDAFMDFSLTKMLRSVFASRTLPLASLLTYLDERQAQLPMNMSRATLLDNHDMNRFLWLADGKVERLLLAAVCHMTLEGTPIVYYGTEVGVSQFQDALRENACARPPMLWGEQQNHSILQHYHRLIELRQNHPVLRQGNRTNVAIEAPNLEYEGQVAAYLRHWQGEYLLVVLNNSEQPVHLSIALTEHLSKARIVGKAPAMLRDLLTREDNTAFIVQAGQVELELAAMSAVVCKPDKR
ncbi:MAG TPA: alpha-amylase family glycosyl hydrolase, partial [Ktedonobacteraceae bacterium]|nr:alpha-amylase family glycosyl hydrolase [Ktedonobacteraceae bacterium]